ncbi:hypothetical protein KY330_05480 [Candidatus Woesearchaeota archaeon]|nr:hypothetical protein [Candidatus Woesearchaeota archaeon]
MVELSKNEKELIVSLLKKELKEVDTKDESIRYENDVRYTAMEEKYEIAIENLIKKLS